MFELVDGTHFHEDRTLLLSIHDFEGEQARNVQLDDLQSEIEKYLSETTASVAGQGVHLFDFYHEFVADDYRSPPTLNG